MADRKITLFMKIVGVIAVTLLFCFAIASSTIMFANPEYIEAAKKVVMAGGTVGLFFAALMIAFELVGLFFAGVIGVLFGIGMVIKEAWKKLTSDDVLGDE